MTDSDVVAPEQVHLCLMGRREDGQCAPNVFVRSGPCPLSGVIRARLGEGVLHVSNGSRSAFDHSHAGPPASPISGPPAHRCAYADSLLSSAKAAILTRHRIRSKMMSGSPPTSLP